MAGPAHSRDPDDPDGADVDVPPEALAPSGRSEASLPATASNPSTADPQADPDDGSTEIPPASPDA